MTLKSSALNKIGDFEHDYKLQLQKLNKCIFLILSNLKINWIK